MYCTLTMGLGFSEMTNEYDGWKISSLRAFVVMFRFSNMKAFFVRAFHYFFGQCSPRYSKKCAEGNLPLF